MHIRKMARYAGIECYCESNTLITVLLTVNQQDAQSYEITLFVSGLSIIPVLLHFIDCASALWLPGMLSL
jgi:hypothetical protein